MTISTITYTLLANILLPSPTTAHTHTHTMHSVCALFKKTVLELVKQNNSQYVWPTHNLFLLNAILTIKYEKLLVNVNPVKYDWRGKNRALKRRQLQAKLVFDLFYNYAVLSRWNILQSTTLMTLNLRPPNNKKTCFLNTQTYSLAFHKRPN